MSNPRAVKTVVKSIAEFWKWAKGLRGTEMLFRGLSKESYLDGRDDGKLRVSPSLCRCLGGDKAPEKLFIAESMRLLSDAKMQGHHWRDGRELKDLALTAELQHFGADTCLTDFSRSPLVALWFACGGLSSSGDGQKSVGVVAAFDGGDFDSCKKVNADNIEKPIGFFFSPEGGSIAGQKFYVWAPSQSQNARITAQQSVFVFGRTAIEIAPNHVCYVDNKEKILQELHACGITKKSLFGGDFDGFARILNSSPSLDATGGHYYHIAREKHASGAEDDLHLAVLYYDKAIEMGAFLKDAYYHRGTAKFSLRDLPGALADANKAVKRDRNNIKNFWLRGIIKSKIDDWPGAIADYGRVLKINPQFAAAHYNLALAKRQLEDYKGAIASYDRMLEINPQDANAYFGRGIDKGNLGNLLGAIADYGRVLKINPQDANAYNNRGNAKRQLGDPKGAIADLDRVLEISPQDASAYNNRGLAYDKLSDPKRAIADFDKAIELNPQLETAYSNRGITKHLSGDPKSAIADFDRAIEINPQYAIAYNNRGFAKKEWRDNEGAEATYDYMSAIADYNRAIELNPQYVTAYNNRGNTKNELGDKEGAAADFQKAEELKNSPQP